MASDDAAKVVTLVETFLNEDCKLGIPAEVNVCGDLIEGQRWDDGSTWLVYKRCGNLGFRIAVEEMCSGEIDTTPWSECRRELKLLTFRKLPDLLRSVASEAGKALRATEEAASAAREILAALQLGGDAEPLTVQEAARKVASNTKSHSVDIEEWL